MTDSYSSSLNLASCMYSSETSTSSVKFCGAVQKIEETLFEEVKNKCKTAGVNGGHAVPQHNPPDYNEAICQNRPYLVINQVNAQPMCSHSTSHFRPQPTNGCGKRKRIRTAFTTYQLNDLEEQYQRNRYLERNVRLVLSQKLNVSERIIKIWFQNRRMKEKKERAECEIEECSSSSQPTCSTIGAYEMPNKSYDINAHGELPNVVIHGGGVEQRYDGSVVNGMPMMDPQNSYLMPSTSQSDHQPDHQPYEQFPQDVPPSPPSNVISPVFEDFGQYFDIQSVYYSI